MMARASTGILFPFAAVLLLAAIAWPVASLLLAMPPTQAASIFLSTAGPALRVSLEASLCATCVATILGVPAGYWLARAPSRLRSAAVFLLALPLAFPPVASGLMLLYAFGRNSAPGGWLALYGISIPDSLLGVGVAEFFVSGSLVALAATAAFAALDPLYEDAARTLGASEWRIFARVALPAAAGNVTAGIAFTWLRAVGEYGATSVLAYHPTSLPVALYVTLSASGVLPALALCYGFVILAALVLGMQWVLGRSVVPSR
jgi:ABC-type sulfate transport system permease component